MHLTFSNAALTICAPRASNPNAGLLHDRQGTDICDNTATVRITIGDHSVEVSVTEERHDGTGSAICKELDAIAFTRAWIVQERLLSPRVLFFGTNQANMECAGADFFENLTVALQPTYYPASKATLNDMPRDQLSSQWMNIVEEFSTCDLTAADDRLPALSGTDLMSMFRPRITLGFGWTDSCSSYHGGGNTELALTLQLWLHDAAPSQRRRSHHPGHGHRATTAQRSPSEAQERGCENRRRSSRFARHQSGSTLMGRSIGRTRTCS